MKNKPVSFREFRSIDFIIDEDVQYESEQLILSEAIHEELQSILDDESIHPSFKLSLVTKKARQMILAGNDTGLESFTPKKGSSRAVFFPKEPKRIILDGQETLVPTAIKIAFPGNFDRYTGHHQLLGEIQNQIEGDNYFRKTHSILREVGPNQYETNPDGVFMPVFHSHDDGHYLEVGRCDKYNSVDLRAYTKRKGLSKGLSHNDIKCHLENLHAEANGKPHRYIVDESLADHPHIQNMANAMFDTDMHPADLDPRNMGIWAHPNTGVKHPVVLDYGCSNEVSKLYQKARIKKHGW